MGVVWPGRSGKLAFGSPGHKVRSVAGMEVKVDVHWKMKMVEKEDIKMVERRAYKCTIDLIISSKYYAILLSTHTIHSEQYKLLCFVFRSQELYSYM